MSAHEDVGYHLDRAQALLEFAGEPGSPQDALIAAQTHAVIGLLLEIRNKPAAPPQTQVPRYVRDSVPSGYSDAAIVEIMTRMKEAWPDWRAKRIQTIKEVRMRSSMGLKDAKDLVDASANYSHLDWWEEK
jgi:hypothetical protein